MSRKVMQMALDALNGAPIDYDFHGFPMTDDEQNILNAIEALHAELKKPELEPVGYVRAEDLEQMKRTSSAWLYRVPSGIASFAIPLYRREDV